MSSSSQPLSNTLNPSESPDVDKNKLYLFSQALKNQNLGLSLLDFLNQEVKKDIDSLLQQKELFNKEQPDHLTFENMKFVFHHLLSTCTALGLSGMANLCRNAEQSCLDQDRIKVDQLTSLIQQEFEKISSLPFDDPQFFQLLY